MQALVVQRLDNAFLLDKFLTGGLRSTVYTYFSTG